MAVVLAEEFVACWLKANQMSGVTFCSTLQPHTGSHQSGYTVDE